MSAGIAGSLERIACALEELVRTSKEKENLPPTPPIREKEGTHTDTPRAGVREGFLVPTLDEVKAFAAANGIDAETAEDFWFSCDGTGWKYKGNAIINWRSMLQSWNRARKRKAAQAASELARMEKRVDEREARRTAHIDAKMDEREARRERRTGGGRRKADNNVEMSDEVREEVRRDFTF